MKLLVRDQDRLEFASEAWFELFSKLLIAKVALGDETQPRVACEVYYNAPRHIAENGRLAWTREITQEGVVFRFEECAEADADLKVEGEYSVFRELTRFIIGPDGQSTFEGLIADAVATGKVRACVDRRVVRPPLDVVFHNYIAALTR